MSARPSLAAVLLLALAGSARAANTVSLSGNLGAMYTHSFYSGGEEAPWNDLRWDLLGSLEAGGIVWSDRLLRWSAAVGYGQGRQYLQSEGAIADRLTFAAAAHLLSGTMLPITLRASRQFTESLPTPGEPVRQLGSVLTNSYEATATFQRERLPILRASLSRNDGELVSISGTRSPRSSTQLRLGASQTLPMFHYQVDYDTSWNEGAQADLMYRMHRFGLGADVTVDAKTKVAVSQQYLARIPTAAAALNPRFDGNDVTASAQFHHGGPTSSSLSYRYSSQIASAEALLDQQQLLHALTYALQLRHTPSLSTHATASAEYGVLRAQDQAVRGMGQTAGGGVTWLGDLWGFSTTANADGHVGLVEREGEPVSLQWGAATGGTVSRPFGGVLGSLGYGIGYDRGGVTLPGWSMSQDVRADLSGVVAGELRLRLGAYATAARRQDRVLGARFSRDVALLTEGQWRTFALTASAGINDGLPVQIAGAGGADGLFLPPRYTQHSEYVTARLAWTALPRLQLVGSVRGARITREGEPAQAELQVLAGAAYSVGLIQLGAEYRLYVGELGAGWTRNATFFATVSRSFSFL